MFTKTYSTPSIASLRHESTTPVAEQIARSYILCGPYIRVQFSFLTSFSCAAVRDLLSLYKYDGDNITIVRGSALAAATDGDPKIGKEAILALMDAVSPPFGQVPRCPVCTCMTPPGKKLEGSSLFNGSALDKPQGYIRERLSVQTPPTPMAIVCPVTSHISYSVS